MFTKKTGLYVFVILDVSQMKILWFWDELGWYDMGCWQGLTLAIELQLLTEAWSPKQSRHASRRWLRGAGAAKHCLTQSSGGWAVDGRAEQLKWRLQCLGIGCVCSYYCRDPPWQWGLPVVHLIQAMKTESRQDVNFVVTGGTAGCHQWRQSWHHVSFFRASTENRQLL